MQGFADTLYYKTLHILFTLKLFFLLVAIEFYRLKQRKKDSKTHFYQLLLNFIVLINEDKAIIYFFIMSETVVYTILIFMMWFCCIGIYILLKYPPVKYLNCWLLKRLLAYFILNYYILCVASWSNQTQTLLLKNELKCIF